MKYLFLFGGLLMVVGAGLFCFMVAQSVSCYVFLAGALLFGGAQMVEKAPGHGLAIHRLKSIQMFADILFIVAGVLMVDAATGLLRPLFSNQIAYIQYVYNKWVLVLLVAALVEMYTMHRLSSEVRKQQGDNREV